jgi:hypothetical protein
MKHPAKNDKAHRHTIVVVETLIFTAYVDTKKVKV